jgi:hypothetical protein
VSVCRRCVDGVAVLCRVFHVVGMVIAVVVGVVGVLVVLVVVVVLLGARWVC